MTQLNLRLDGAQDVVMTRTFAAPPDMVYRAHTEPHLLRQWMLGLDGWSMPVCTSDSRPGGAFHFEWDDGEGGGQKITGEYLELDPGARILHVERMFMPDPSPDSRIETVFAPQGSGTLLTLRMTLPDPETRTAMLDMGMQDGMEQSYAKLDALEVPFPPAG
jgi:uncharacterized protein YndB with AHSA1/START domain